MAICDFSFYADFRVHINIHFWFLSGLRSLRGDVDLALESQHGRLEAEQLQRLHEDSESSGTSTTRSGGSTDYSDDDRQSLQSLTSWYSDSDSETPPPSRSLTVSPACSFGEGSESSQ